MPIVRHRSGPLAGQEQQVDQRTDRITFGRDPAVCDVVFPPDLTLVARRHFALVRKPSGEWTFESFGDPYVAVNGEPAEPAQTIHTGDVIELGKRGGPALEVVTGGKDLGDALPVTDAQEKFVGTRATARRTRRLALAGLAAAVLATGATGAFILTSRNDGARLERAVSELARTQADAAADSIGAPVRDKLLQAAYVVIIRDKDGTESASGSASPIAGDLLATNAHVAATEPGQRLLVRAPGVNGRVHEVVETRIHPGYKAFDAYMGQDPLYVGSASARVGAALGYDVATLRVAKDANLGPILEIESREELDRLRPGMPIGIAGYPLERIAGSEVQTVGATPNLRVGMISAVTDLFHLPAEPAQQKLITHNIPITGGNSGSPMVGADGKLIGLINSGSMLRYQDKGRMPNAAIINYGQRADMLLDLLEGRAEAALGQDQSYWAKQTAAFKRGFDLIVPMILAEIKPKLGAAATEVGRTKDTLASSDQFTAVDRAGKTAARRQKIHAVTLKAGVPASFIAYAQGETPIELYLVKDGQVVAQHAQGRWFPYVTYQSDKDLSAEVYVVGPDQDVSYTFLQYAWPGQGS